MSLVDRVEPSPDGVLVDVFVARRPVLDAAGRLRMYELRYRHDERRTEDEVAGAVLDAIRAAGPDAFGRGRLLVRAPLDVVREERFGGLAMDRLALDVAGCTDDDLAVPLVAARRAGALVVAVDNPVVPREDRLLTGADLVRVDASQHAPPETAQLVANHRRAGRDVLATNVETREEQARWARIAVTHFQGLFLNQPAVMREQVPGNRLATLQLLASLDRPELDVDEVVDAVSASLSLSIKVLQYVNSAFVGLRNRVDSIRQAVVLLGPPTVRQIAAVAMMGDDDQTAENSRGALVRARFCDAIARSRRDAPSAYYTAGLLSAVGPIVQRPLEEVLSDLPLTDEVVAAVLHREGRIGEVVQMAEAYETARWEDPALALVDAATVTEAYLSAIAWVDGAIAVMA